MDTFQIRKKVTIFTNFHPNNSQNDQKMLEHNRNDDLFFWSNLCDIAFSHDIHLKIVTLKHTVYTLMIFPNLGLIIPNPTGPGPIPKTAKQITECHM